MRRLGMVLALFVAVSGGVAVGQTHGNGFAALTIGVNGGGLGFCRQQVFPGDVMTIDLSTLTGTGVGPALAFSPIRASFLTPRHDVGGIPDLIGLDLGGSVVLAFDLGGTAYPFGSVRVSARVPVGFLDLTHDVVLQGFIPDPGAPPFSLAVSNACRITEARPFFRDEVPGTCLSLFNISDAQLGSPGISVDTRDILYSNTFETRGHSGSGQQSTFILVSPGQGSAGVGPDASALFTCTDVRDGFYTFTLSASSPDAPELYLTDSVSNPLVWVGSAGQSTAVIADHFVAYDETVVVHVDGDSAADMGPRILTVTRRPFVLTSFYGAINQTGGMDIVIFGAGLEDSQTIDTTSPLGGHLPFTVISASATVVGGHTPTFDPSWFTTLCQVTVHDSNGEMEVLETGYPSCP